MAENPGITLPMPIQVDHDEHMLPVQAEGEEADR